VIDDLESTAAQNHRYLGWRLEKGFCPGELEKKNGINLGNRADQKGPHGQRGDVKRTVDGEKN
jgi:hypothetical protein